MKVALASSLVCVFAFLGLLSGSAYADVRSYCLDFARHEASLLPGNNVLLGGAPKPADQTQKAEREKAAFADCMSIYGQGGEATASGEEKVEQVKVSPASSTEKESWKAWCARKYVSFNPDTGMYKSLSGKQRRCTGPRR